MTITGAARDWAAAQNPGPIVDRRGQILGQHQGLPNYTIGQRKGLGISGASEPLFVLALDHANNRLVVGAADELGRDHLVAAEVNWVADQPPADGVAVECKIRYKAQAVPYHQTQWPWWRAYNAEPLGPKGLFYQVTLPNWRIIA